MSDTATYVDALFGDRAGRVAVRFGHGRHAERRYTWPAERDELLTDAVREDATGNDVWIAPALRFGDQRRKGDAVPPAWCWVDVDHAPTDEQAVLLDKLDALTVASGSEGCHHYYVALTRPVDLARSAVLNRALRDRLAGDAKWSDESLLRLPGTHNHKTDPPRPVLLERMDERVWDPDELGALLGADTATGTAPSNGTTAAAGVPEREAAPDPLPEVVLGALARTDVEDRSGAHHRLVGACRDAGLTLGQAVTVAESYAPSVDKYDARAGGVPGAVAASWSRVGAPRLLRGTDSHTPAAASPLGERMVDGGAFIHDAPGEVPALWGSGDEVLWAQGEPCLITGPPGVGKTTLGGQVVAARLGLIPDVLGYDVVPGRRLLYLAMDRPAQIRRALGRLLRNYPREVLAERLAVWQGPPPMDLARHPTLLLELAQEAGADTVVLDSLKDAAVKLSDEEVGQGLNRALQHCVAEGVEVLGYHHQTKRGGGGIGKPTSLADVYGSAWITAGAGSVVLLWGEAGDPVVELSHLKQPAAPVGPLQVTHDHDRGTSSVADRQDPLDMLRLGPRTASGIARVINGTDDPTRAQVEKARRRLDRLVVAGQAVKLDAADRGGLHNGSRGGSEGARYGLAQDYGSPS